MSAQFVFNQEFDDLKATLKTLPQDLVGEADHIVEAAANAAAAEIKQAYPVRTGKLRDNVYVSQHDKGRLVAGATVKNTAKHAYIFENGTQARHTDIGANRGSMPPGHIFIPAVMRWRRVMNAALKALAIRKGLLVSGNA